MGESELLFHRKYVVLARQGEESAIIEMKVFRLKKDEYYPEGLKYSLYLVNPFANGVLVGFDNHKPKGHHYHLDGKELPYCFVSQEQLIEDFFSLVQKKGFNV